MMNIEYSNRFYKRFFASTTTPTMATNKTTEVASKANK